VLPYFRKMEDSDHGPDALRGRGGPQSVRDVSRDLHPLCQTFLRAGVEAGYARSADLNGAAQQGVGTYEITTAHGRRMSAARAYLHPAMARPNLRVETGALATRLQFAATRACAVDYLQHAVSHSARAAREVIVCAGAIASPMLLQRSGIGAASRLQAMGIGVVHDLPAVGGHLQDHLCIDHLYRARVPTLNDELRPWYGKLYAGLRYLLARSGPLALSVNQAGGFVSAQGPGKPADLQLYFSPLSYTRAPSGKRPLMSPDPFPGFLLSAQPCRPTSRGHLEITSADPLAPPRIVPNSLATDDDLEHMLEGSLLLRRLASMPAFAAVIAEELRPGPALQSRAALIDDIRARASTVFHPVGTCRMGADARDAVVDSRLRAHGVAGLRIVDASVFPAITSGNTNAPVLMVAEKAADLITEDAR
jgi:choline dehydrogenase